MKLFKNKGNNKGFSLVELVVVVAIMAVLLGVLVPTLIRHVESSRLGKDKQALDNLKEAVEIALASEKYAEITLTNVNLNGTAGTVAIEFGTTDLLNAFEAEVQANLGNKTSIALSSKLKKDKDSIKISVANGMCTITSDSAENGDYDFSIPEAAAPAATSAS